ncbi:MAG: hypothetical protein ACXAC7_22310 [Candidatus Hodarchaeales archaeon]|jgi:hypothetical protein
MEINHYKTEKKHFAQDITISGHEMLIFKPDIDINAIRGWVFNQFSRQRKTLIFDDQSFMKSLIFSGEKKESIYKPIKLFAIDQLFDVVHRLGYQKMRETIRNHIWKAITGSLNGISFLFNFTRQIKINKTSVINFEKNLSNLLCKSYGFPIDCCCIYPSSLGVLDFAELANLHDNYQIFNDHKTKTIQQPKFQQTEPIDQIAIRSLSGNNYPFYFRKGSDIIGTVYDLEGFYELLNSVPLDVFCFHCYRECYSDLTGKEIIKTNPRSDIALWIEFSIGDTYLAQQIYDVLQKNLGTTKSLTKKSRFSQTTIRSSILRLIAERIIFLSTITT